MRTTVPEMNPAPGERLQKFAGDRVRFALRAAEGESARAGARAMLRTARAYLGSIAALLAEGCLGQLPEITDGDAPHTQQGCDAQAWSATEALRVWKLLNVISEKNSPL